MINTLYIESEILAHPRVKAIQKRFPNAKAIECERYQEVFNPKSQNFRLQKSNPSLILAKKHEGFVLPTPSSYGIGGEYNYYFSHMLNCVYDCRYCFLQGMYRSAHYVVFVNYEDFADTLCKTFEQHANETSWYFSGYDCDSLAFEPITRFIEFFLPLFAKHPQCFLELRTKSTQIRSLLNIQALPNVVVAFSFTPDEISSALEHKVPSATKRIEAMQKLQKAGYTLGLRFDPMIYDNDYQAQYKRLFNSIFSVLKLDQLHSVSFGPFRLPKTFHKNIVKLYPDEALFAGPLEDNNGMVSYNAQLETEMMQFCNETIQQYIPEDLLFPCELPN